ncbi:MAG: hypothetical protein DRR42_25030 [Gammaproteobacteria bacterium]|nr:MAG: hypothetical protein DRR42_25030 [Gammaproteobacteria bacterium]
MLNLIYLATTIIILLINLAGVAALFSRWFDDRNIARAAGILSFVLLMFFFEHFIGLGQISWMWPLTTAASLWLLNKDWRKPDIKINLYAELIFVIGFAYGFFWRFTFPDINPRAEEITDLYFMSNYMAGATLPPPDMWLAGYKFNIYYAFQHYAAALMGRMLNLDIGHTYNFAWCVMVGLIAGVSWSMVSAITKKIWIKILVVMVVLIGGNGISPLTHLLIDLSHNWETNRALVLESNIWTTIRFIGGFEDRMNTDLAVSLFTDSTLTKDGLERLNEANSAIKETLAGRPVLSMETLSYLIYSGDFHPPVGGIFLLLLTLAIFIRMENSSPAMPPPWQVLLGASVPLSLVINAWTFPLQVILVGSWALYKIIRKQFINIPAILLGATTTTVLLLPFLQDFSINALSPSISLVSDDIGQKTPWGSIFLYIWPEIILAGLALFNKRYRWLTIVLILFLTSTYLFSSFFYFDDPLNGTFERFNTILKWWAWTHALAMAAFTSIALSNNKARQWIPATIVASIIIISYGYDLGAYVLHGDWNNRGKFHGHHWFTQDQTNADLLKYLKESPDGRVLENIWGGAYNNTGRYALFAQKPLVLGWPSHIAGWRGSPNYLSYIEGEIKDIFYGRASKESILAFLRTNKVRYIIWSPEDNQQHNSDWEVIDKAVSPYYFFHVFYREGANRKEKVGIWVFRQDLSFSSIDPG